jgi:glutaredoxin 3
MPVVTIYTKPWCGYCFRAKRLLDAKGVEYNEIDVTLDDHVEAEMIRRSGQTTAPQVFVGDRYIGDSTRLAQLEARGELDAILNEGPEAGER